MASRAAPIVSDTTSRARCTRRARSTTGVSCRAIPPRSRAGGYATAVAHTPDIARSPLRLGRVLDALEQLYGPQKAAGPTDPYETILFLNCGYPATDDSCTRGFVALKREVG